MQQMQMPYLIDGIRRRNRVICGNCQKGETAVLRDCPSRIAKRPAVVFPQLGMKGNCRRSFIEGVVFDALIERIYYQIATR